VYSSLLGLAPFGTVTGCSESLGLFQRQVTFQSSGTTMAGTVVRPVTVLAAVVIVQGAGPTRRMLAVACDLAKDGVAVLTYDKRGVGESGGTYVGSDGAVNVEASNLGLLAEDASAAADALSRIVRDKPLGLFGYSQAGWIIPLAARMNPKVKFIVLFSGPAVTTHEQMRFQELAKGQPDFWNHYSEAKIRNWVESGPDRFSFTDTDPTDSLRALVIPGLWLYGRRDVIVPVELSTERLERLIREGKPFRYRVLSNYGHKLNERVVLPIMIEWIKSTVVARQ
jgi:uncharacterized protein